MTFRCPLARIFTTNPKRAVLVHLHAQNYTEAVCLALSQGSAPTYTTAGVTETITAKSSLCIGHPYHRANGGINRPNALLSFRAQVCIFVTAASLWFRLF